MSSEHKGELEEGKEDERKSETKIDWNIPKNSTVEVPFNIVRIRLLLDEKRKTIRLLYDR